MLEPGDTWTSVGAHPNPNPNPNPSPNPNLNLSPGPKPKPKPYPYPCLLLAVGVGKFEMPLAYMAIAMGGHVRPYTLQHPPTPSNPTPSNTLQLQHPLTPSNTGQHHQVRVGLEDNNKSPDGKVATNYLTLTLTLPLPYP